jgi:hypothetical protein
VVCLSRFKYWCWGVGCPLLSRDIAFAPENPSCWRPAGASAGGPQHTGQAVLAGRARRSVFGSHLALEAEKGREAEFPDRFPYFLKEVPAP